MAQNAPGLHPKYKFSRARARRLRRTEDERRPRRSRSLSNTWRAAVRSRLPQRPAASASLTSPRNFRPTPAASQSSFSPVASFRIRLPSSGSRANHAYCSLNFSRGRAGVPPHDLAAANHLCGKTPACPPTIAPSSILQCSPIPAWPPTNTLFPSVLLPEMPV